MEFLKNILGEELYAQVAKKLSNAKNIKLANLADGGYVSREKFLAAERRINELQDKLAGVKGTEDLLSTIEKLTNENSKIKSEYESRLLGANKEFAIKSAITLNKAKNERAVRALIDEDKLRFDDGKILGLEEQLAKIKTSDGYLFDTVRDTGESVNPSNSDASVTDNDLLSDAEFYRKKGYSRR